jgi:hypothetical protein
MPKKLMLDIFRGYHNQLMDDLGIDKNITAPELQAPPAGEAVQAQETPVAPGTVAPEGVPNATQ